MAYRKDSNFFDKYYCMIHTIDATIDVTLNRQSSLLVPFPQNPQSKGDIALSKNRNLARIEPQPRRTSKKTASTQPQDATVHKLNARYVKKVEMIPRNMVQEKYIEQLLNLENRVIIASGSAGTGKTYLATLAAIKSLKEGEVNRIVITRPMVEVENEKIGFLPGGLQEKMDPWLRPIFDIFEEYFSKQEITGMIEQGTIEICPLAFMRGRSLKDCFIILDESQNCTPSQLLMVTTRLDRNSRIAITGDTRQTDRKGDKNGLIDLVARVKSTHLYGIAYSIFDKNHVERDEIVQTMLELYDEE